MVENTKIALPEDVFRLLRDLISDYCGLHFDDSSRFVLERRLNRRLQINGFDNFRDYYRFLLYSQHKEEELSEIMDVLTVNETYFFREQNQLVAFIKEICPDMKAQKQDRKIRIWSAGCASGEEPYSIAMLILENSEMFNGWDIEIIGSDINHRVLQVTRKGLYRRNSFRNTDELFRRKYFLDEDEGTYRIRDEVKRLVSFNYMNLLDPVRTRIVGAMDIIFCRNVLIYFHAGAKKKVIESFYQRINDGGYLLLGHAESLINVSTSFALKHLKSDMVYQKPKKPIVSISNESLYRMVWGR